MKIKNIRKEIVFSLNDYKGDLHVHTKDDPEDIKKIAFERIGSNCAHTKMGDVLDFMLNCLKLEYVAITNHSRDAAVMWQGEDFKKWLIEKGVKQEDIEGVMNDVHKYGDERLLKERKMINKFKEKYGNSVLRGIEANVLENGDLDTNLVKEGFFDFVVTSVHPWNYKKKPSSKMYQRLLLYGINHPKTNIMAHIGYGYSKIVHKLDWGLIAQECIANQVALEINIAWIFDLIERMCLENNISKKVLLTTKRKFNEKVPIFSSEVFEVLSKYFSQGLRLAVNTDFHLIDRRVKLLREKNYLYWRVLKGLEVYMNDFFRKHGVQKNMIINQLNREDLQKFIDKNYYL